MAMYFAVDLPALARTVEYLPLLEPTDHAYQVAQIIEAHLTSRPSPAPPVSSHTDPVDADEPQFQHLRPGTSDNHARWQDR